MDVLNLFFRAPGIGVAEPDVGGQKVLRWLQNSDCDTVGKQKINRELSHEIEGVMRGYLKYLLEREVKSAAWLDTLKREQEIAPTKSALL